jgi:uncharacterized protein DUF3857
VPNRRPWSSAAILLALLCSAGPTLASAADWPPIKPEELKMTDLPEAAGAPAVILFRQVDREDKLYGSSEHVYVRIKVLTEEGRKYADVDIPTLSGSYDITSIRGRTVHPDGTVFPFDGKLYDRLIVKSRGIDYQAKVFTLSNVQIGSVLEYEYNTNYRDLHFFQEYWILSDSLFTRDAKFSIKPYVEHGLSVQWTMPAGLPPGVKPPQSQGPFVVMEAHNVPSFQTEDYMPPVSEFKYQVVFTYSNGTLEKNPDAFWRSFAKKQNDELEAFIGKRSPLEKVVADTLSPGDSAEVKLHKLYARVQKIRNLSYELQKSAMEKKLEDLKPVSTLDELLTYNYGYRHHINFLFIGLARTAGFQAHLVLLSNRKQCFFNKERMNTHELPMTAAVVTVNGREVYLDPGGQQAPFGLLPWEETGVPGLKVDKVGGSWIETDLGDSTSTEVRRVADLTLAEDGALEGKLAVTFTGQQAYALRINTMLKDDAGRRLFLENKVKEYAAPGIEVELTNKPDLVSSAPSLVAEFHIKSPGWASITSKRAILPVGLFGFSQKHLFETARRTYPVYFEYPEAAIDEINVQMPVGWQVGSLPGTKTVDMKAAKYDLAVTGTGNNVHIKRQLNINFVLMDQKFYPPLRSFFQTVRTGDEQQVVLKAPTTAAAAN